MKIRILEILVSATVLLTASQYLQDFSDDMVMFMKTFVVVFLIVCDEMRQYLKICIALNQYFPSDQCVILQNHAW